MTNKCNIVLFIMEVLYSYINLSFCWIYHLWNCSDFILPQVCIQCVTITLCIVYLLYILLFQQKKNYICFYIIFAFKSVLYTKNWQIWKKKMVAFFQYLFKFPLQVFIEARKPQILLGQVLLRLLWWGRGFCLLFLTNWDWKKLYFSLDKSM